MHRHLKRPASFLTGLLALGFLCFGGNVASSNSQSNDVHRGSTVAPRVDHPDTVCRSCHRKIYDLYQQTPMAQGSGLAIDGLDDFQLAAKDLVHPTSGVTYRITLRDHQPYLHYARPGASGRAALDGEYRLDFFVGSGHRGRTYLYNIDGLWFETPINWYGKTKMWDMAPAYDNASAMPDPLPVDSNCLHCHAGDVQTAVGPARNRYAAQPFRAAGIGCSSCHGDPTLHLSQTHQTPGRPDTAPSGLEELQNRLSAATPPSIVNPAKLDVAARDSICLQCHLEGDAAVYLPGKSLQAFKPGEDLSKSVTYFIDSTRSQLGYRASSQYEALLRSACKRAVGNPLTCTTCHDPHSSPSPTARIAYFRSRCLACHVGDAIATRHHPEQQDCAACHMPTRKTDDISHEQLTDHDIEARPDLHRVASPNVLRKPAVLVPVGSSSASIRELGLAYAQLAGHGDIAAGKQALELLLQSEQADTQDTAVLDQLGFLLQASGMPDEAAKRYQLSLKIDAFDGTAQSNLAVIEATKGEVAEAISLLIESVQNNPSKTVVGLNLAFLQCSIGQKVNARQTIERVLRYNPDSGLARLFEDSGVYGNKRCFIQY